MINLTSAKRRPLGLTRNRFTPGAYVGVGENSQQELDVDARFPRARNDKVAARVQIVQRHHLRSVAHLGSDLLLNLLSVVDTIYLRVRRVLPELHIRSVVEV